jgi:Ala-tRNA(Pro) deacylase
MSAERVHALLDDLGIAYERHQHPREVAANRLADVEEVSGWKVAKPVILSVHGELAMAVVPAAVHVDLDKASNVLGHAEVRLATEEEFVEAFPDCDPGAEPPFGSLYGVPVFLDESLRQQDRMVCRDGSHEETISLAVNDYVRAVQPEIVDLAVRPA